MSILTEEQRNQFLDKGYVVIKDCFPRELAEGYTEQVFARLGYDPNNRDTWLEQWVPMPILNSYEITAAAPKAWQAICEVMGGEDRIKTPHNWSDGFIANFGVGANMTWQPPSPAVPHWHKDGDFFRHFLDSPEQGLLTIVLWTDIAPMGGGTFIATDSVSVVSRFLAEHPEGVRPSDIPFGAMIQQCTEYVECIGQIGDVVLLHPYILHTASQNHSGKLRLILNPPVQLKEPMQFNRSEGDYSLVEMAVLKALGVDRYDFVPTRERERIYPERERKQQEAMNLERERLTALQR